MLASKVGVRQRLEAERDRLIEEVSRLNGQHYPRSTYSNHPADCASDVSENAMNRALIEIHCRHLAMVEDALRRLQAGTYGVCQKCGRNIDPARLEVVPHAYLCVEC